MSKFSRTLLENCTDIDKLNINIKDINFKFSSKPLVIGGKALEYYGVRDSKNDIDLVVTRNDYEMLLRKYPNKIKRSGKTFVIWMKPFEIWRSMNFFNYDFLSEKAVEEDNFLIISFEKLMLLKALAAQDGGPKHLNDMKLMRFRIMEIHKMINELY